MDHPDKIEGMRYFCTDALADGNYRYRWGPLHVVLVCLAKPVLHTVKRKMTGSLSFIVVVWLHLRHR
jgi:hypothetical protein